MCAQATELGLPAVAFTDHLDLMAWEVDPSDLAGLDHLKAFLTPEGALALPPVDIGQYLECVDRCRDKFPDLRIITGMELGQPHRTGKAAAELPGFGQLERVLGSLHVLQVGNKFFEPPGLYRLWPAADVMGQYLAEVPRMIDGSDAFAVLTHIDYAVRYWPTKDAGPGLGATSVRLSPWLRPAVFVQAVIPLTSGRATRGTDLTWHGRHMNAAEELISMPTLIVVSGPAGSGKTTLAHRLASAVGCPALCRDEIKEGMVAATPGFVPATFDPLTRRTYSLFFVAIRLFLEHGVTHVAEAAFQHAAWARGLEPLGPLGKLRVVRCHVDPVVARSRAAQRMREHPARAAHDDAGHFSIERSFEPITIDAPTLDVDTTDGYVPELDAVANFARSDSYTR
jgi:predicted kinase/histidinol phosphatase-like PHP family hydrolase